VFNLKLRFTLKKYIVLIFKTNLVFLRQNISFIGLSLEDETFFLFKSKFFHKIKLPICSHTDGSGKKIGKTQTVEVVVVAVVVVAVVFEDVVVDDGKEAFKFVWI
jgi:hypothetical protein